MERKKSSVKGTGAFVFAFPDEQAAKSAMVCLEAEGNVGKRSSASFEVDGCNLRISLKAKDVVSMRASINGVLRAITAFESIENV